MNTNNNVPVNGTQNPFALTVAVNNTPTAQKPFIEVNTIESSLQEIRSRHIIALPTPQ
jgi:hypothetical protein